MDIAFMNEATVRRSASLLVLTLLSPGVAVQAQGIVERMHVHGESLEGNLMGEPAAPFVSVYLPPSYTTDSGRRYPVVYMLHGYFGSDLSYFGSESESEDGRHVPSIADRAFGAGAAREVILVMPNCDNAYRGCMYSNSPTTGYWESYIADNLVAFVDANYRTIPSRESRGLAGHSMGGYGTMKIGMKRPDVFSAIYALSSCCLAEVSPFPTGEQGRMIEATKPEDVANNFIVLSPFARAAAWAPNPGNPPYYFDLGTEDGVIRPDVAARWAANSPSALLASHVPRLASLNAIMLDVGEQDGLIESNRAFSESMDTFGVDHVFETYEGDHTSGVAKRIETRVLPFFSTHLRFE